eukprot:sb/3460766/
MADPLFSVKTAFYIGAYRQCVKEAQKLQLGDQALALECDVLMYRAYLAEGKFNLVIGETESRHGPEFRALVILAKILQSPADKDSICAEVGNVLNEGAVSVCPDLVALLCANIYLSAGDYDNALRVANSCGSLECSALALQTLLQINRVDMATKEFKKIQERDEDATVSQLAFAALNVSLGETKSVQTAFYIYQELADKFGGITTYYPVTMVTPVDNEISHYFKSVERILSANFPTASSDILTVITSLYRQCNVPSHRGELLYLLKSFLERNLSDITGNNEQEVMGNKLRELMYGMNVLVFSVNNGGITTANTTHDIMSPPHKRRRVDIHQRIVGTLAEVVKKHSTDVEIHEILQIFTTEVTTMDIPHSDAVEVERHCSQLLKVSSPLQFLVEFLELLRIPYFRVTRPVLLRPTEWFLAPYQMIHFPLADYTRLALFKKICGEVLPRSLAHALGLFMDKFRRAPNPQKQMILDRIASVDLSLSRLQDKSYVASVFAAFGDCFEVFAKSKAGLPPPGKKKVAEGGSVPGDKMRTNVLDKGTGSVPGDSGRTNDAHSESRRTSTPPVIDLTDTPPDEHHSSSHHSKVAAGHMNSTTGGRDQTTSNMAPIAGGISDQPAPAVTLTQIQTSTVTLAESQTSTLTQSQTSTVTLTAEEDSQNYSQDSVVFLGEEGGGGDCVITSVVPSNVKYVEVEVPKTNTAKLEEQWNIVAAKLNEQRCTTTKLKEQRCTAAKLMEQRDTTGKLMVSKGPVDSIECNESLDSNSNGEGDIGNDPVDNSVEIMEHSEQDNQEVGDSADPEQEVMISTDPVVGTIGISSKERESSSPDDVQLGAAAAVEESSPTLDVDVPMEIGRQEEEVQIDATLDTVPVDTTRVPITADCDNITSPPPRIVIINSVMSSQGSNSQTPPYYNQDNSPPPAELLVTSPQHVTMKSSNEAMTSPKTTKSLEISISPIPPPPSNTIETINSPESAKSPNITDTRPREEGGGGDCVITSVVPSNVKYVEVEVPKTNTAKLEEQWNIVAAKLNEQRCTTTKLKEQRCTAAKLMEQRDTTGKLMVSKGPVDSIECNESLDSNSNGEGDIGNDAVDNSVEIMEHSEQDNQEVGDSADPEQEVMISTDPVVGTIGISSKERESSSPDDVQLGAAAAVEESSPTLDVDVPMEIGRQEEEVQIDATPVPVDATLDTVPVDTTRVPITADCDNITSPPPRIVIINSVMSSQGSNSQTPPYYNQDNSPPPAELLVTSPQHVTMKSSNEAMTSPKTTKSLEISISPIPPPPSNTIETINSPESAKSPNITDTRPRQKQRSIHIRPEPATSETPAPIEDRGKRRILLQSASSDNHQKPASSDHAKPASSDHHKQDNENQDDSCSEDETKSQNEEEEEEDPDIDEESGEYQERLKRIAALTRKLTKIGRRIRAIQEADIGVEDLDKWGNLYLQKFPDIQDIRKLIVRGLQHCRVKMKDTKIDALSRQVLLDIGSQIQLHRKTELRLDGGFHLMDRVDLTADPAKQDTELRKKLNRNKKEAGKKLHSIQTEFDDRQFKRELQDSLLFDDDASEGAKGKSGDDEEGGSEQNTDSSDTDEDDKGGSEGSGVNHTVTNSETSKQPIRTRYLGHVTDYQPIRDQYFLIRSVPGTRETI